MVLSASEPRRFGYKSMFLDLFLGGFDGVIRQREIEFGAGTDGGPKDDLFPRPEDPVGPASG